MKYQILGKDDRFELELRKNPTEGEEQLWHFLRNRRFHGYKFRRQHRIDYFYLDFYCAELKLAIEVDGKPHFDEIGEAYDAMRTRILNRRGIRVIRFVNGKVAIEPELVLRELERLILPLTPSPSPRKNAGRGEAPFEPSCSTEIPSGDETPDPRKA